MERPQDWPGPNAARALVDGEPVVGYWFNRTEEYYARRQGIDFEKYDFATRYEIELKPLPSPMLIFAERPEVREAMSNDYKDFAAAYEIGAQRLIEAAAQGYRLDPRRHLPDGSFAPSVIEEILSKAGGFNPEAEFPKRSFPRSWPFIGGHLAPPPPPLKGAPLKGHLSRGTSQGGEQTALDEGIDAETTRIALAALALAEGRAGEAEALGRQAEQVLRTAEASDQAALAQGVVVRALLA